MGALLHLMDWQKVQLGLDLTVACAFLLGTYGVLSAKWDEGTSAPRRGLLFQKAK
jgi:hypothetical protein